ncbi:hypothetical protein [Spiroplasma endosymbiont of Polydrusus pterygomalis]|uniref:hypothetical protein n=1 Tax=Spiroplasma endosymbiont of Polydrusus pterygomalis TaxID=3139327 RepID=UPI003CCB495F
MKKIMATGFVLTILLGTSPQIRTLTVANTKINHKNNLQDWTPTPENFKYIEKYFKTKTVQEIQELKENLLSAIGLKNYLVTFDKTKLNQKMWDLKIYQIITSDEYLQVLNWYYKNKIIIFDEQGKAHFNILLFKNLNIDGIWFETYIYWFGYCRLHFSSNTIASITEGGTTITEIAEQIIEVAPYLGPVALLIAGWVTANIAGLRAYDYGKGSWVAFHVAAPVIPLGYGSN